MAKDLGLNPDGSLPTGWHRVRWVDPAYGAQHIYTDSIGTMVTLSTALRASTLINPATVTTESWTDYPHDCRNCST